MFPLFLQNAKHIELVKRIKTEIGPEAARSATVSFERFLIEPTEEAEVAHVTTLKVMNRIGNF